jgi:hypothetical protein
MSRAYLVFGSDDEVNWELLNTVQASGGEQAMGKAREQQAFRHYGACPERNWTSGTPEVYERDPVIKWKTKERTPSAQMTVEDALPKPKKEQEPAPPDDDDVIERAEAALAKAKEEAAE